MKNPPWVGLGYESWQRNKKNNLSTLFYQNQTHFQKYAGANFAFLQTVKLHYKNRNIIMPFLFNMD